MTKTSKIKLNTLLSKHATRNSKATALLKRLLRASSTEMLSTALKQEISVASLQSSKDDMQIGNLHFHVMEKGKDKKGQKGEKESSLISREQ